MSRSGRPLAGSPRFPQSRPRPPRAPPATSSHRGLSRVASVIAVAQMVTAAARHPASAAGAITVPLAMTINGSPVRPSRARACVPRYGLRCQLRCGATGSSRSRMIISSFILHRLSAGPRRGGARNPNPRRALSPRPDHRRTAAGDPTGIVSQIIKNEINRLEESPRKVSGGDPTLPMRSSRYRLVMIGVSGEQPLAAVV
jgi:hypothetical protein